MNNQRRNKLQKLIDKTEALKEDLLLLQEEEQEYYDNMPEGLQNSDKGTASEEAISNMESAIDYFDNAIADIQESMN